MPGSEIEAVVTLGRITCSETKVVVVVDGTRGLIFVITHYRLGASSVTSPSRIVAPREVTLGAVLVSEITCCKHSTRDRIQQSGGGPGGNQIWRNAAGNDARPH